MKVNKKITLQYIFTVEGKTELWYLNHLQSLLNGVENLEYNVKIIAKVQPSPFSYAKNVNSLISKNWMHLCDVESKNQEHVNRFNNILSELNKIKTEKHIKCVLGYSNYTFELWIVLHKQQLSKVLNRRENYLEYINNAYNKNFENLKQYKEEKNFKEVLKQIDLDDVKRAIKNAEKIEKSNLDTKEITKKYGYKYYLDNPSLSIHTCISKILEDCKIINET